MGGVPVTSPPIEPLGFVSLLPARIGRVYDHLDQRPLDGLVVVEYHAGSVEAIQSPIRKISQKLHIRKAFKQCHGCLPTAYVLQLFDSVDRAWTFQFCNDSGELLLVA